MTNKIIQFLYLRTKISHAYLHDSTAKLSQLQYCGLFITEPNVVMCFKSKDLELHVVDYHSIFLKTL
jgi:hypothetical protein